ncbi:MAG: M23 family metallopeptidase [Pseudomonadota bacterium]
MNRKSGQFKRSFGRFFKERQIYHRSDGVVHFISMSSKTQIALAMVATAALSWIAYATVNVVFKEQIIVAKEQEFRLMANNHSRTMLKQVRAYDELNIQNAQLQKNMLAAMDELAGRHQMLRTAVSRKSDVDDSLVTLSERLAEAGTPSGAKPKNANRVMVDVRPGEPTPRQSRTRKLQFKASQEASATQIDVNATAGNEGAVEELEKAATSLYTEQLLLLAELEESASREADELRFVLDATGVKATKFLTAPKIANTAFAQGGPFIDIANLDTASPVFIQRVNRTISVLNELEDLKAAVERIPLSSPSVSARRVTSPFGFRRDPFHGKLSPHNGLDFQAAYGSPVTSTARGVVRYAGWRPGYGKTVEVDHGNGFMTRFAHMRKISVKKGQKVKLHDKVGELGSSGRSTGPHIHYEIHYKGKPQNPARFIEAGRYVFES